MKIHTIEGYTRKEIQIFKKEVKNRKIRQFMMHREIDRVCNRMINKIDILEKLWNIRNNEKFLGF